MNACQKANGIVIGHLSVESIIGWRKCQLTFTKTEYGYHWMVTHVSRILTFSLCRTSANRNPETQLLSVSVSFNSELLVSLLFAEFHFASLQRAKGLLVKIKPGFIEGASHLFYFFLELRRSIIFVNSSHDVIVNAPN